MKTDSAIDPKQMKDKEEKDKLRSLDEVADMKKLLEMAPFRRFMYRTLNHLKPFQSVYHASGSQQSYNIGLQDAGHYLMGQVSDAEPEAIFKIMKEGRTNV